MLTGPSKHNHRCMAQNTPRPLLTWIHAKRDFALGHAGTASSNTLRQKCSADPLFTLSMDLAGLAQEGDCPIKSMHFAIHSSDSVA